MQIKKSLLMFSLMSLMFLPSSALAAQDGDYTYTESGGNATVTAYTGAGGDISIPAALGGYPTVAIGDYAFFYNTSLTSVIIPGSVRTIGTEAFRYCTNVTSLVIPEGVTTIGYRGFARMYSLTSVFIPASVTSIGTYGFFGGKSNTGITVHADNPNYSSLDGVLYNKNKTALIQYACGKAGSFTTPASVTSIGIAAFELCSALTSVTFTDNVTNIAEAAFGSCSGLTSVTIPASITSIGYWVFSGCDGLTSITVDAGNPNYSSLDGVLYNKTQTTLVQYPGARSGPFSIPSGVTNIFDSAFWSCAGLTSVTIPASVTNIENDAFWGCSSLTSALFYGNAPGMGSNIFYGCASGLTVYHTDWSSGFTNPWYYGFPTALFCPAPELNAPEGATTSNPAFSWTKVNDVAWYNIIVWSEALGGIVASPWFGPTSCSGSTCTAAQLGTALPAGNNWWWLNVWYGDNVCGFIEAPDGKYKAITVGGCSIPSLTSPNGGQVTGKPTFTFTTGGAEWVNVNVWTSAGYLALSQWEDASVKCPGGNCTVVSNIVFPAGTTNWWWLNTYSDSCGFQLQPGGLWMSFTAQ